MLEKYRDFLINERKERVKTLVAEGKRVPSNRNLSLYLTSLRHLYGEAQKFYNKPDKGLMRIPHTPFEYFKIPKQEATRKRALQPQQIRAIWNIPYQEIYKGAKHTCRPDLAKDCFILSFCLMGINSVDLYNATELKGNKLVYERTKTKDRRPDKAKMVVTVPQMILPIIELSNIDENKKINSITKEERKNLVKLNPPV